MSGGLNTDSDTSRVIPCESLGDPTEPGVVHIRGLGHVYVSKSHLDFIARHGTDYDVEIVDSTSPGSMVREWAIVRFL